MAIRRSPEARDDIAYIYAYGIDDYGFQRAEDYLVGLLDTVEKIAANPRMVREHAEVSPPVRLYPYRAHHILYAIVDEDVLILRILHHSANWIDHL